MKLNFHLTFSKNLIILSICIIYMLQDHFTHIKKMTINMKYIGTFQNSVNFCFCSLQYAFALCSTLYNEGIFESLMSLVELYIISCVM